MGLYHRCFLPRLIDCAMSYEEITRLREKALPAAKGVVVEAGIGSGLNLPFYTPAVTKLYGIDTSVELLERARPNMKAVRFPVELLNTSADEIALPDATADTVVVTFALCSIAQPAAALREMRRVLKPEGTLIFVEHGLAPDIRIRTWQNRLTPVWRRLCGGCHLNRPIDDLIRSVGFSIAELNRGYIPGPRVATYVYEGRATRHDA